MLLQRLQLAAQRAERPYLAPFWLLLLLSGLVAFALIAIYPQKDLIKRLSESPESELSRDYLINLLRTNPDNPELRLLLARQELAQGKFANVRATLQPTLNATDPDLRKEALWLLWQTAAKEYSLLPTKDKTAEYRHQLAQQLRALMSETWPEERLIQIAGMAFAVGEPALAISLHQQLAQNSPNSVATADRLIKVAADTLASGNYRESAELLFLARRKTTDPAQAKRCFLNALRTLQSGNLLNEAMAAAEREIEPLSNDSETLLFLTQLARSAGRPDLADRYVRQLLRLSLLRQLEQIRLAAAHGGALPQKAAWSAVDRSNGPQLAFDDKIYTLGYEVFLENGKLDDAWKVAASAVRQAPDDMAWRERLAKVAEWTHRPEMALDNWLLLARQTQRDEAWQAVLRLAPGLFNDSALSAALQYELTRKPGNLQLLRELVAAWERQGEPRPAIDFLIRQSHIIKQPLVQAQILEMLADLAERAGDTPLALESWRQLFAKPGGLTPARAVRATVLAITHGKNEQGLAWLEQARQQAIGNSEPNSEFWRLLGQLAQLEQREGLAIEAYTQLTNGPQAEENDLTTLQQMLLSTYPLEAAKVAVRSWERFDQPKHLLQALNIYAGQQQWTAIGALLSRLDPAPDAAKYSLLKLRRLPDFLRLSGLYYQHNGQLKLARRDLTAALTLTPNASDIQQSLLWLLIDSNDGAALRRLLGSQESRWSKDAALHDALGSAYLALSLPKVALDRYLTPHLAVHQNDFLWLMNYADALDQNQQGNRAWRMRRHLLSAEWQAASAAVDGKKDPISLRRNWLSAGNIDATRRLARSRLLITQRSGDTGLDALREMLRLDRDANQHYSNAAVESIIGWLQEAGEYTAERGYLWQQYSRSLSQQNKRPLWAEISVALAHQDKPVLGQLLDEAGERLPRYDRINAARNIGALRLAQSDAFDTQDTQSDDDPLHMQLADSLLEFSDHAGGAIARRDLGAISEQLAAAEWHLAINPKLSLDFELGRTLRQNRDESVIRNVPNEKFASLRLNWREADSQTTLLSEKRSSLTDYAPLQIEREQRIDDRLSLRLSLGQHLPSRESTALRVAGMKDRLALGLNYQATRVDRISLEQISERYELQTGSAIGRGQHTTISFAHALRQDSRDLEIDAFWSALRFNRESSYSDPAIVNLLPTSIASVSELTPGFFLPDSFTFYGLRLSTDLRYEKEYSRAIRPYASLSKTWHSELGPGYDLRFGLAGSLFGADHFSLTWGLGKAGIQTGGLNREIYLNYRIHY